MSDSMFKLNIEEVFTLIVEVYTIAEYIFGCFIDLYMCISLFAREVVYNVYQLFQGNLFSILGHNVSLLQYNIRNIRHISVWL